jgi:inner membrane protein
MPTVFSHGIVAVTIANFFKFDKFPWQIGLLGVVCSVLPDLDVIGFRFGIRYGDLLGHRGLTHSFFFAGLLSLLVTYVILRSKKWNDLRYSLLLFFFIVTAFHGILDAMTNGGLGVAFFSPFYTERYFFPFRPIPVSPIGLNGFLTGRGLRVLISEMLWIWLPSLILIVMVRMFHMEKRVRYEKE